MLIVEQDPGYETISGQVTRVFDGDGFMIRIAFPQKGEAAEVSIRCGFIDAPEMNQPGGPEARDFLNAIIGGQVIELVVLTKMDTGGIVDRHGRLVAVPYLPAQPIPSPWSTRSTLPRNVELEMVVNGWAWVLDRYCPGDIYFEALEDAQQNRRGIWASEDNLHPWEHKKQQYNARSKPKSPSGQGSLFDKPVPTSVCPKGCGGSEVVKTGRFGQFVGCTNFPDCRYTRNM